MNRRTFFSLAGAVAASPALAFGTDMQKQLKIVGLETDVLRFPPGQIFYDAIHEFGAASGAVVLRLKTDAGITGWASSSFGTMEGGPLVLQSILQNEVKQVLVGQDPGFPKRDRLCRGCHLGHSRKVCPGSCVQDAGRICGQDPHLFHVRLVLPQRQ